MQEKDQCHHTPFLMCLNICDHCDVFGEKAIARLVTRPPGRRADVLSSKRFQAASEEVRGAWVVQIGYMNCPPKFTRQMCVNDMDM